MGRPLARLTCPICESIERMELFGPLRLWSDRPRGTVRVDPNCSYGAVATVCPNCETPFGVVVDMGGSGYLATLFTTSSPAETDAALRKATLQTVPRGNAVAQPFPNLPPLISENFQFIQEENRAFIGVFLIYQVGPQVNFLNEAGS